MLRQKIKWGALLLLINLLFGVTFAQEDQETKTAKPQSFLTERATEDYRSYQDSINLQGFDRLKYLPLDSKKVSYLSFGGSFRPRMEHFTNRFWSEKDETYYSQRLSLHSNLEIGKHIRFFGELYHAYKTGGAELLQTEAIDWHQGFVELKNAAFSLRLGRQEMSLGAGRLVDLRTGPNLRRSFDMAKLNFRKSKYTVQVFYGTEVQTQFEAFDNAFELFTQAGSAPRLWGIYSQFSKAEEKEAFSNTELYYLGFQSNLSNFSDLEGAETRHSIGIRRSGTVKKIFRYNSELIYQFGEIGIATISALSFETDWKYTFANQKLKPTIGLKLDWASGDQERGDTKLQSFNPMFVNPAIYSLAAVNTPINLMGLHPSLILIPSQKVVINLEYALFYRVSIEDGLYAPANQQIRPSIGNRERGIGNVLGLFMSYSPNKHLSFDLRSSYFTPGNYIRSSGNANPIFHTALTATSMF